MCTSIIEIARAEGMAKRGDEWFPLSQAVVAYDHARHAPLGDVITLDFINIALEPGAPELQLIALAVPSDAEAVRGLISASVSIGELRCGRKTTKCFGRTATLRQPRWGLAFNPALRFVLRHEAGNMVTFAVGPGNSDVPSRS